MDIAAGGLIKMSVGWRAARRCVTGREQLVDGVQPAKLDLRKFKSGAEKATNARRAKELN